MSETQDYPHGTIVWRDLTVPDADAISRFYEAVTGWERSVHEGCDDFNMTPPGGSEPTAGVCYKAGTNAGVPSQWLIYVAVDDIHHSIEEAGKAGGKVVDGPRYMGNNLFCVIEDPVGAVIGLISNRPVPKSGSDE